MLGLTPSHYLQLLDSGNQYIYLLYGNYEGKTFTSGALNPNFTTSEISFTVDETLPFSQVTVPYARVVTLFHEFFSASLVINDPINRTATSVTLKSLVFRASKDGGAATDYAFLGPNAGAPADYTNLTIRGVWVALFTGDVVWNASATYTFTRLMGLRLFYHQIHLAPTLAHVALAATATGAARTGLGGEGGGQGSGTTPSEPIGPPGPY